MGLKYVYAVCIHLYIHTRVCMYIYTQTYIHTQIYNMCPCMYAFGKRPSGDGRLASVQVKV